jgi:hypothetical protein
MKASLAAIVLLAGAGINVPAASPRELIQRMILSTFGLPQGST